MAKRTIAVYECDLCKKEVTNKEDLTKIRLPYRENGNHYFMDDYDKSVVTSMGVIVDCCDSCTEKIAKLLGENFGFYDIDEDKSVIK